MPETLSVVLLFYDFFLCVFTEGVKMRGTKGPADVNRHSSDQTVSIGIPYKMLAFHNNLVVICTVFSSHVQNCFNCCHNQHRPQLFQLCQCFPLDITVSFGK